MRNAINQVKFKLKFLSMFESNNIFLEDLIACQFQ